MTETFFIGDTHLGHSNILTFTDEHGKLLRSGFNSIEEMNEHIITQWNNTVKPQDKIYHCGDVAFGKEALQLCNRLNGIKYLVMGNHDRMANNEYARLFTKIYGVKYMGRDDAIVTHVPVHPTSLRRFKINIHGHVHTNNIDDSRYFNVSCENINYTPISLTEILEICKGSPTGFNCLSCP